MVALPRNHFRYNSLEIPDLIVCPRLPRALGQSRRASASVSGDNALLQQAPEESREHRVS